MQRPAVSYKSLLIQVSNIGYKLQDLATMHINLKRKYA